MVNPLGSLLEHFDLTPGEAALIGGVFLVVIILIDVFASVDETPANTPREQLLEWTRCAVKIGPIRLTGAVVPFGVAALVGHFFHPWTGSGPLGEQFDGLKEVLILGFSLSLVTGLLGSRIDGRRWVVGLAVLGLLAGIVLWPVGA